MQFIAKHTKMMNKIITRVLISFTLLLSCCNNNAHEKNLTHEILSNKDLPLKVKIGEQKQDSIPIHFYIPIKFKYINNSDSKLKIKHSFWSKESPNTRHSTIYFKHNKKLVKGIRSKYLEKQEEEEYQSFVRFELLLDNQEFNNLFNQEFSKNEIYDLKFEPNLRSFLNSRLTEKGYVISIFFDTENKKNIIYKIPLNF